MKLSTTFAALVVAALPLSMTATLPASGAETAARAKAPMVKAKVKTDVVIADEDVVKVTGKVSRKAAGTKVVLQQRFADRNKWSKTGTAKVKKNGKFVLKDDPNRPGTRYYRVLKPAGKGIKKGFSKELEVVVYAWQPLSWRIPGPKENLATAASVQIGTTWYNNALTTEVAGKPAFVEYTLGDKCRSLEATYALTDASLSGSTGTVSLSVDGVVKVSEALSIGQVKTVTTDVTDAFRIRFDQTSTTGAIPTAAEAKALCTA